MIDNSVPQPVPVKRPTKKKGILIVGGILLGSCCLLMVIIAISTPSQSKEKTPDAGIRTSEGSSQLGQTVKTSTDMSSANNTSTPLSQAQISPTNEATTLPKPEISLVGEQAEEDGTAITVISVQRIEELSFDHADEGYIFLDIDVLIENINLDGDTPYNSLYFKIKDDTAAEYSSSFSSLEPSLNSGSLSKGEKARGHVAFEIPISATGLILYYEPAVLFGGYEPIRVNLDQETENPRDIPGSQDISENQIGQRFENAGIGVTILSASTKKSIGYFNADSGMIFVDIEVLIENISRDEETPYNPLYFKIKDSKYQEYNTAFTSLDPSLHSGDLGKGDKVRGHVAFEVPADIRSFTVSYEPMVLFGGYQPISINIILTD